MASSRGSTASSKPPKQRLAVTAQSATSKPWFTCSQPNSISCFQTEIVATHAKQRRTQKINLQRQLADLGVQHLHIHHWRCLESRIIRPKYPGDTLQHLCLPGRDLVRVHIILLSQLGQRLLSLDGGQRHLGLESRCMCPAYSSRHGRS